MEYRNKNDNSLTLPLFFHSTVITHEMYVKNIYNLIVYNHDNDIAPK